MQHHDTLGKGFKVLNHTYEQNVPLDQPEGYIENMPKDCVTALPGQVTVIKTKFEKKGRYVWHCHILSHEDHEMMRIMHVDEGYEDFE